MFTFTLRWRAVGVSVGGGGGVTALAIGGGVGECAVSGGCLSLETTPSSSSSSASSTSRGGNCVMVSSSAPASILSRGIWARGVPNEVELTSPILVSSSSRFSENRSVRDGSPLVPQNLSSCGDVGEAGALGGGGLGASGCAGCTEALALEVFSVFRRYV